MSGADELSRVVLLFSCVGVGVVVIFMRGCIKGMDASVSLWCP